MTYHSVPWPPKRQHGDCWWPGNYLTPRHLQPSWWRMPLGVQGTDPNIMISEANQIDAMVLHNITLDSYSLKRAWITLSIFPRNFTSETHCHIYWYLGPHFSPSMDTHMPNKLWDEITYPFLNFNGYTVEVWEWRSYFITLRWRQNGRDSVSNHQPGHCLFSLLFGRRSKKTLKLRVTGLCVGNHRDRWIPRTKGQLRGKCFHLMTSSWHIS